MKKNMMILTAGVVALLVILPAAGFTQDTPPGIAKKAGVPGEGLHKGWEQGRHAGWNKEELLKLKDKDPEKFKALVGKRQEQLRQRLQYLKQADPEKYQRVMQQIRQRRLASLYQLRKENPEKFKELMQQRKENIRQRLEDLKARDPEKYQRIVRHREQVQHLMWLKKEDPAAFREYLNNHPGLRDRLENIRGRPEVRHGRRQGNIGEEGILEKRNPAHGGNRVRP